MNNRTQRWLVVVVILLCVSIIAIAEPPRNVAHVVVETKANWRQTPLVMEAIEFFAQKERQSLFLFLEKLTRVEQTEDEISAGKLIDLGNELFKSNNPLLQFALTTRHYSPQVNLQLEKDSTFDPSGFKITSTSKLFAFDYVSENCENGLSQYTVVHANMQSAEARKKLAEYNGKCFVFRHMAPAGYHVNAKASDFYMVQNSSVIDSLLSVRGYGVELQIKDMEYKQQEKVDENQESTTDLDQDGILFQKLTGRYPHLESDLQTFRDFLQKRSKSETENKIQVWQLASIGIKATDKVFSSDNKLDTLIDLAQNFPLHVSQLVASNQTTIDSNDLKNQIQEFNNHLEVNDPTNARETIRRNSLFINGRELDLTKLTLFSLFDILSDEQKLLNKFKDYALDGSQIEKILYGGSSQPTSTHPRFFIDSDFERHVTFVNDIELDHRYQNFPSNLQFMTQPAMYGSLRFSKRNVFTAIFVFNAFAEDAVDRLGTFLNLIYRGYPIKFGIVLLPQVVSTIGVDLLGGQSAGSTIQLDDAVARYIIQVENIAETRGAQAAAQFLMNSNINQGVPSLSDEDRAKLLSRHETIGVKMGLSGKQSLLMNGVLWDASEDSPDRVFMNALKDEYDLTVELVRENKVKDSDTDILRAILANYKTFKKYNPLVFGEEFFTTFDPAQHPSIQWRYSSLVRQEQDPFATLSFIICYSETSEKFLQQVDQYLEKSKSSRVGFLNKKKDGALCDALFGEKSLGGIIAPQGKKIVFNSVDQLELFTSDDFEVLESQANAKLPWLLSNDDWKSYDLYTTVDKVTNKYKSDVLFGVSTLIGSSKGERINLMRRFENFKYKFTLTSDSVSQVQIFAIINPLSQFAQKWGYVLSYLHKLNYPITIVLNPEIDTSNMPLKSLYRFVIEGDKAEFELNHVNTIAGIYTLAMDTSETWLVESTFAQQDLDNMNIASDCTVGEGCYARFQLEHLVVTGSCMDTTEMRPPRGLQLELIPQYDSSDNKDVTLVMANYGYFQLKSNTSSIYSIQLPSKEIGRHSEIFSIASVSQTTFYDQQSNFAAGSSEATIYVNSFDAPFVSVNVKRNPGKAKEELLKDGESSSGGILSYLNRKEKVVNIFTIASGHMYERLLKIMALSVTKHTKRSKVKFWLLKQFLSPQFKKTLPKLAEHYGFQYGFVSYAWPHWLHKQTQKQRIIWAYKVLFLDVLFPLREVKKIIFVDADQICRTDMTELYYDFNMQGNSLAYTPFCSDRTEMDGFRFWKQGYWSQHLRGRPYHISALYAVDISQFRQKYHGDQLRMFYDSLSKDPNSLSNLDQDLPNYAQHVVPITSLPQEWLWCETWCSDQSKPKAKTIDLCNNPKTKEHKLTSARRIVPEWQGYDDEIKEFERQLISK